MKISTAILSCWLFGSAFTAHIKIRNPGLQLLVRDGSLKPRSPARGSKSAPPEQQPSKVYSNVEGYPPRGQNFQGTTFAKNERRKQVISGDNAIGLAIESRRKASSGGTLNGGGTMHATATGKNTQVKLTIPSGSHGSYYAEKPGDPPTLNYVDHTQSPFRWNPPVDRNGHSTQIHGHISGPGSVKVKAWN